MSDPSDPRPDELIVDLRLLDPVVRYLHAVGVLRPASTVKADPDLELALLTGLTTRDHAALVTREYPGRLGALGISDPLDTVIFDLQRHCGEELGSVPVLEKNRDTYVAYPQHKAPENPTEAPAPLNPQPLPPESGVRVGLVDTAPELGHAYLADRVDSDTWLEPGTTYETPWAGHGTFAAGAILGAAPAVRVVARTGLDADSGEGTAWDVAVAIASFRRSGIKVLNLSFGCVTVEDRPPLLIERALSRLDDDVLVVAAAGNVRRDPETQELVEPAYLWPAAAHGVRAVGSQDPHGKPGAVDPLTVTQSWLAAVCAGTSVTGAYVNAEVRLSGPDEPATEFRGGAIWSGTSFAAARASGLVAAALADGGSPRETFERLLTTDHSGLDIPLKKP